MGLRKHWHVTARQLNGSSVRIARARELLISGNTPQKMIAQSLGYSDAASFARVFRKATGAAPGAYRKRFGIPPGEFAPKARSPEKQPKLPFRERVLGRVKQDHRREILEGRPPKSRPDRGMIRVRTTTYNQNDEPVQTFTGDLIVPRRPPAH